MLNDLTGIWTSCFMLLFLLSAVALLWMHLAIQRMEQTGQAVAIPVQSDNEIGVLTESFNEMARSTP